MAKTKTESTESTTAAAAGPGGRKIMLTVDGKEVARVDFIRDNFLAGKSRGEIRKMLKELGHEVPYQIIFQATKGVGAAAASEQAAAA